MTKEDWRRTLFVWDGILSFVEGEGTKVKKVEGGGAGADADADEAEAEERGTGADPDVLRVRWRGTWIGSDVADAVEVRSPKRGAFDQYVSSDHAFAVEGDVSGMATTTTTRDDDDDDNGGNAGGDDGDAYAIRHRVDMTGGSGYELGEGDGKRTHLDDRHDVHFLSPTLRWSGKVKNQLANLVLAIGENEFGHFLSVGWLRVGNRVTLARRYVDDDDVRSGWDVEELRREVLEQIATKAADGHVGIVIPPWQCATMHADMRSGCKRKKIASKSDG